MSELGLKTEVETRQRGLVNDNGNDDDVNWQRDVVLMCPLLWSSNNKDGEQYDTLGNPKQTMERRGVLQIMMAMVKVNLHGDGKPPRQEQVMWPTLMSRGGLSYLRRCTRMQHSYVREQLSKGASVVANLLGELSGRAVE